MLRLYLRLDISSNLCRALSCLRLSCRNSCWSKNASWQEQRKEKTPLVVMTRPARTEGLSMSSIFVTNLIGTTVHWTYFAGLSAWTSGQPPHSAPSCLVLPPLYEDSLNCLRSLLNQPNASSVAECIALFPSFCSDAPQSEAYTALLLNLEKLNQLWVRKSWGP